jgi:hypothetical protein
MNSHEIVTLLVKTLILVLTPIATKYHIDGNLVPAFTTDAADLLVVVYSIWRNTNMKIVPETATAIALPGATPKPVGAAVGLSTGVAAEVVGALLIGFMMLQPAPANAQAKRPPLTGNVVADIANATATSTASSTIGKFLTDLAAIPDAVALSTAIPGLADPVGNACWQQFAPLGELIKAHPLVFSGKAAADIEALRLAAIGLNQICANPNCGQMFVDATNAAGAIAGNPLGISLASLCAKVPVIGTSAVPTANVPTAGIGTVPATK